MGSMAWGTDWVTLTGTLELPGTNERWLAQRASWIKDSFLFSLSLARLSLLCLRSLFFLGVWGELLASFLLFSCILLLGIAWECLGTFLRGDEALGIVSRELCACDWLFCITLLFLGTVLQFFGGHCVSINLGCCLSGFYMMRLVGMRVVDPVYTTISKRCFHNINVAV